MTLAKTLTAAATVIAVLASPFVAVNVAQAKSLKCYSMPVPGKPGMYVWNCSAGRP